MKTEYSTVNRSDRPVCTLCVCVCVQARACMCVCVCLIVKLADIRSFTYRFTTVNNSDRLQEELKL